MKKIIFIILSYICLYFVGVATTPIIQNIKEQELKERIIYEIVIDTEYINLRKEIDLYGTPIMKVYKNEKYQVVEYHEGNSFNWYKIIYDDYKTGWIASGKEKSWVKINN